MINAPIIEKYSCDIFLKGEFSPIRTGYPEVKIPPAMHTPAPGKNDLQFTINELPISSLLAAGHDAGILKITLTDKKVQNLTDGLLHLRTSDFKYFIPELMDDYGDVSMAVTCNTFQNYPIIYFITPEQSISVNGTALCSFFVNGAGYHMSEVFHISFDVGARFSVHLTTENQTFFINFKCLTLENSKQVGKKDITIKEIEAMESEFNNILKYAVNGLNALVLDKGIKVPDLKIVTISGMTLVFHKEGYLTLGADLKLNL